MDKSRYTPEYVKSKAPFFFAMAKRARSLNTLRDRLSELTVQLESDTFYEYDKFDEGSIIRVHDCTHALRGILKKRSDDLSSFSVAKAIRDVSRGRSRPDLSPAFWAEMFHVLTGAQGGRSG